MGIRRALFFSRSSVLQQVLVITLSVIFSLGCKVGQSDVESWKGTVKGPGKLAAVLKSDRYSTELKTVAALTMVEMDRSDVNGLSLLHETFEQLKLEDASDLSAIADGTVSKLKELMSPEENIGKSPTTQQVSAKDAAYVIIPYTSAASKTELTKAVVGWYAKDFPTRSLSGDYSAEQVTEGLGGPAAVMLVDALDAKMPAQALIKIAEIISQHGDDAAKGSAAKRLVAIEKDIESPAYVQWLEGQINAQYANSKEKPDPARVRTVALYNRERRINNGALPAMKFLGDQSVATRRLLQIASTKPAEADPKAWAERLNARRARALQALEGHATRKELNPLLRIALDSSAPTAVRDFAFDRVADIGSPNAIPSLWPLIQSTGCASSPCSPSGELAKRLRWRAGEMALSIGGANIVNQFLGKLPGGAQYEPGELTGYATRMSQMSPPPTTIMRGKLDSQSWWAKVMALRFLERKGDQSDIARIKEALSDTSRTNGVGWKASPGEGETVGKVAASALAALKARLTDPAGN